MILADTAAWVEYDRATGSAADRRITDLIVTSGPLMFTEPVLMEVLAGARSDAREDDLRRLLLRCDLARFDVVSDFEARPDSQHWAPGRRASCDVLKTQHRAAFSSMCLFIDIQSQEG